MQKFFQRGFIKMVTLLEFVHRMNSETVDALDNFALDSTECRKRRPQRQDGGCGTKSELV